MKHFLITRFNLRMDGWESDKNKIKILSEEWLTDRFNLFLNYCFPSVKNQTNQEFIWLVYFDTETPDLFKELVNSLSKEYNNFEPRFIDGGRFFNESIIADVLARNSEDFILTTRLDNDDALHEAFIDVVQRFAEKRHNLVVDIRKGYQMIINKKKVEYRVIEKFFNPYLSLVQKSQDYKSIFSRHHAEWKNNQFISYDKEPLWLQLIHERNKSNQVNRHNVIISGINLKKFGISKQFTNQNIIYVRSYNFLMRIFEILTNRK